MHLHDPSCTWLQWFKCLQHPIKVELIGVNLQKYIKKNTMSGDLATVCPHECDAMYMKKKGKVGQIASLPVSGSTSPRSKLRFSGWAKIQRPNSTHLGELFAFNSNHRRPLQLPSWKRESTPPTNTWPASASLLNWGPKNPTNTIQIFCLYNTYPTKPTLNPLNFEEPHPPFSLKALLHYLWFCKLAQLQ